MAILPRHPCLLTTPERLDDVRRHAHPLQQQMFEDMLALQPQREPTDSPCANAVMPSLGNQALFEAIRYLLTGDRAFAQRSCRALEEYIGTSPGGTGAFDYDALGVLYAVPAFDCLYDYLNEPEARAFRRWLLDRLELSIEIVYEDAERLLPTTNNHYTRRLMALAAAAWSLRGEMTGCDRWRTRGLEKLDAVLAGAPPDGSDPYGGTWLSTHPLHPLYATLFHYHNGIDRFATSPYLRGLARFRWYTALGEGHHSLTLAGNSHWTSNVCDASELYLLAARYRDPYAQWTAHRIRRLSRDAERVDAARPFYEFYELDPALSLLAFDPTLEARDPAGHYPTSALFAETGWSILRADWRADGPVIALCCAPPGGRHRHPGCNADFWHAQPNANDVFLYRDGQFLVNGPGPVIDKSTAHCNTLTVDGIGQVPVGYDLPEHPPTTECFFSAGDYDITRGNAAGSYPPEAGLERFERTLLFIKPDWLVLFDDAATARPAELVFRFHSCGRWLRLPGERPRYQVENDGVKAVVDLLPDTATGEIGTTFGKAGYSSYRPAVEHLCVRRVLPGGDAPTATVWSLVGRTAAGAAATVEGEPGRLLLRGARGSETVLLRSAPGPLGAGDVRADARVCSVGRDADGRLRRLLACEARTVDLDGARVLESEAPVEALSLQVLPTGIDVVVQASRAQAIRLAVAGTSAILAVEAGESRHRLPVPGDYRTDRRFAVVAEPAFTITEASVVVDGDGLRAGDEVLLVGPPSTGAAAVAEAVRLAAVQDRRVWLGSPVFEDPQRYGPGRGGYVSRNLIPNGDFADTRAGYWSNWPGAPLAACAIDRAGELRLAAGERGGVAYLLVGGLEQGAYYRLACWYRLAGGSARLDYHDPRGPDTLSLPASQSETVAFADLRFGYPAHGRPFRGAYRNRPEFLLAFRVAPGAELAVTRIELRRR